MQYFDLNHIASSAWKNGGGSTREIACFPPGASTGNFAWRISVATIAQPGPFSIFTGIDRHIMLLDGDGVRLVNQDTGLDHRLSQRWQPFAFSGDLSIDCELLGVTSTDFNVMVRRADWCAQLQLFEQATTVASSPAGLYMVLDGTWQWGGRTLQAGQGFWWAETAQRAGQALSLTPLSASGRLIGVQLAPRE